MASLMLHALAILYTFCGVVMAVAWLKMVLTRAHAKPSR